MATYPRSKTRVLPSKRAQWLKPKPVNDFGVLVKMKPGSTLLDFVGIEQYLEYKHGIPVDAVEEGGLHRLLYHTLLTNARRL